MKTRFLALLPLFVLASCEPSRVAAADKDGEFSLTQALDCFKYENHRSVITGGINCLVDYQVSPNPITRITDLEEGQDYASIENYEDSLIYVRGETGKTRTYSLDIENQLHEHESSQFEYFDYALTNPFSLITENDLLENGNVFELERRKAGKVGYLLLEQIDTINHSASQFEITLTREGDRFVAASLAYGELEGNSRVNRHLDIAFVDYGQLTVDMPGMQYREENQPLQAALFDLMGDYQVLEFEVSTSDDEADYEAIELFKGNSTICYEAKGKENVDDIVSFYPEDPENSDQHVVTRFHGWSYVDSGSRLDHSYLWPIARLSEAHNFFDKMSDVMFHLDSTSLASQFVARLLGEEFVSQFGRLDGYETLGSPHTVTVYLKDGLVRNFSLHNPFYRDITIVPKSEEDIVNGDVLPPGTYDSTYGDFPTAISDFFQRAIEPGLSLCFQDAAQEEAFYLKRGENNESALVTQVYEGGIHSAIFYGREAYNWDNFGSYHLNPDEGYFYKPEWSAQDPLETLGNGNIELLRDYVTTLPAEDYSSPIATIAFTDAAEAAFKTVFGSCFEGALSLVASLGHITHLDMKAPDGDPFLEIYSDGTLLGTIGLGDYDYSPDGLDFGLSSVIELDENDRYYVSYPEKGSHIEYLLTSTRYRLDVEGEGGSFYFSTKDVVYVDGSRIDWYRYAEGSDLLYPCLSTDGGASWSLLSPIGNYQTITSGVRETYDTLSGGIYDCYRVKYDVKKVFEGEETESVYLPSVVAETVFDGSRPDFAFGEQTITRFFYSLPGSWYDVPFKAEVFSGRQTGNHELEFVAESSLSFDILEYGADELPFAGYEDAPLTQSQIESGSF